MYTTFKQIRHISVWTYTWVGRGPRAQRLLGYRLFLKHSYKLTYLLTSSKSGAIYIQKRVVKIEKKIIC